MATMWMMLLLVAAGLVVGTTHGATAAATAAPLPQLLPGMRTEGECGNATEKFGCEAHHWNCGWCNPVALHYPWLASDDGDGASCVELNCDTGMPRNSSSLCADYFLAFPPVALRCVVVKNRFTPTDRLLLSIAIVLAGCVVLLAAVFAVVWFILYHREKQQRDRRNAEYEAIPSSRTVVSS